MGIYQKKGYKRLSILITVTAGIISPIILSSLTKKLSSTLTVSMFSDEEVIIYSLIATVATYFLVRLTYWTIDGFRDDE